MRRQLTVFVVLGALLASGCGGAKGADNADTSSAPDGTTATTAGGSDSSEAEGGAGKFGSIESPCGPGDAKVKADQAGAGADKLYIGVANDRTSIRNGLLKELFDGATGFAKWCNEQGGVAGLPVEVVDMDGKLFEIEGAMAKACTGVFAMVGGGYAQDNLIFTGKDGSDFHKCKLIDIPAFAVSVEKSQSNGQVQPLPNPPDKKSTQWIQDFKAQFPEESKKNIVVYGDLPSLTVVKKQYDAGVQAVGGIEQLPPLSYPVTGLTDWTPLAQKVIDSGATSLYWIGEPTNAANLFAKLREQGWDGVILNETNIYDPLVFSAGNAAAEGILVRMAFPPFEEASKWPAVQQYLDNLEKYVPDGKKAALGLQSTSAWLLFATAVNECGQKNDNVVDRTCVLEQAQAQKDWTAGGMHVPTQPGGTEPPECGMLIVAKDGEFERFYPEIGGENDDQAGFHCPPDSVATVTEDLGAEGVVDPSRPS